MRVGAMRYAGLVAISVLLAGVVTLAPRLAVSDLTASTTVGGITYVSKSFVIRPSEWKTFRAPCPAGTHVLGGGHYNSGSFSEVIGAHSYPYDGDDRGRTPDDGWAALLGGFNERSSVTMYAQCASTSPTYVEAPGFVAARFRNATSAGCPAGHQVLSGGTRGHRLVQEVSSAPFSGAAESWSAEVDNLDNVQRQYAVLAVCFTGSVFSPDPFATDTVGSRLQDHINAACPMGFLVVGGGVAQDHPEFGTATIAANRPIAGGWETWVDNYSSDATFYVVTAVCIAPLV